MSESERRGVLSVTWRSILIVTKFHSTHLTLSATADGVPSHSLLGEVCTPESWTQCPKVAIPIAWPLHHPAHIAILLTESHSWRHHFRHCFTGMSHAPADFFNFQLSCWSPLSTRVYPFLSIGVFGELIKNGEVVLEPILPSFALKSRTFRIKLFNCSFGCWDAQIKS